MTERKQVRPKQVLTEAYLSMVTIKAKASDLCSVEHLSASP